MKYCKCKFCGKEFEDEIDAYKLLLDHTIVHHSQEYAKVKRWLKKEEDFEKWVMKAQSRGRY